MRKIISLSFLAAVIFFTSCKKEDFNPGTTNLQKTSNNWWVTLSFDGTDIFGTSVLLTTYNTADDKDSIWVDDLGNIDGFKCKAKVNTTNSTFEANKSNNVYYDGVNYLSKHIDIEDGKILHMAGHSKSGVITDSINMKITFSDDPGDQYVIAGVARTGLVEDDY
jgi:hypothetical protein